MTSIQELLNYLVNVQNPSHQAVHFLVKALEPTRKGIVGCDDSQFIMRFFELAIIPRSPSSPLPFPHL